MPDPLPMHHEDRGCYLHPACLTCPRPTCVYDDPAYDSEGLPRAEPRYRTNISTEQVMALRERRMTWSTIAATLGVSLRTVMRVRQ